MLIKNAKLSDGTQVDVLIRDGKIAGLMQNMPAHGEEVTDAAGRTLMRFYRPALPLAHPGI